MSTGCIDPREGQEHTRSSRVSVKYCTYVMHQILQLPQTRSPQGELGGSVGRVMCPQCPFFGNEQKSPLSRRLSDQNPKPGPGVNVGWETLSFRCPRAYQQHLASTFCFRAGFVGQRIRRSSHLLN